jgi:hypothetical protein
VVQAISFSFRFSEREGVHVCMCACGSDRNDVQAAQLSLLVANVFADSLIKLQNNAGHYRISRILATKISAAAERASAHGASCAAGAAAGSEIMAIEWAAVAESLSTLTCTPIIPDRLQAPAGAPI